MCPGISKKNRSEQKINNNIFCKQEINDSVYPSNSLFGEYSVSYTHLQRKVPLRNRISAFTQPIPLPTTLFRKIPVNWQFLPILQIKFV